LDLVAATLAMHYTAISPIKLEGHTCNENPTGALVLSLQAVSPALPPHLTFTNLFLDSACFDMQPQQKEDYTKWTSRILLKVQLG